jgi:DinB superfamily
MRRMFVALTCGVAMVVSVVAVRGAGQAPAAPAAGGAGGRQGQPPPAHLVEEVQRMFTPLHANILRAAEQFPEDKYTWQPTPDVRSWARLIGHLVDDNNGACFMLAGVAERPAMVDTPNSVESGANKKSKADLVALFRASVDLCVKAFAAVTPSNMTEPSGGRGGSSKIGILMSNTSHTNEHYGNLVTYMRLQGLVPPSSQGRGGPAGGAAAGPGRGM